MRKVLVVDDEKLIVKGLKFSLEQDDMEVDCAWIQLLMERKRWRKSVPIPMTSCCWILCCLSILAWKFARWHVSFLMCQSLC